MVEIFSVNIFCQDEVYVLSFVEKLRPFFQKNLQNFDSNKLKAFFNLLEIEESEIEKNYSMFELAYNIGASEISKNIKFFVKQTESFFTIFCTAFTPDSLSEIKSVLNSCSYPILFLSNYEDDYLEIYIGGQGVAENYACYGFCEQYGKEKNNISELAFLETFARIANQNQISEIFSNTADFDVVLQKIESIFKIPVTNDINYLIRNKELKKLKPFTKK